jgi:hypothetical protein
MNMIKKYLKWIIPIAVILAIIIYLFSSSGISGIATDYAQSYADTELYEEALDKAKSDKRVTKLLGEIEPIDKLAILEGHVNYSNDNKTVNSSIRVSGNKLNAIMDITANREENVWNYEKIHIRVKNPPEMKQTIEVIP